MSEKEKNKSIKPNYIFLLKQNNELYEIFHNQNSKEKLFFIPGTNESKLYNYFLISFLKNTKIQKLKQFISYNKKYYIKNNNINNKLLLKIKKDNNNSKNLYENILSKFLYTSIFNSNKISKILNMNQNIFEKKISELIQIFFLYNLIENTNIISILKLKILSSLYTNENNDINEESLDNKNMPIKNIIPLEYVFNFLLSFKQVKMNSIKIIEFTNIINDVMKLIDKYLLINYNNIYLLSNSLLFYKLIELSQISLDCIVNIIHILKKVYLFNFKINYYLNDLSEQFLLKQNENIIGKNNNIIGKNNFLYELIRFEKLTLKEQRDIIIKNGFIFNDDINNGIILNNEDSFIFPNELFSSVISFKLIINKNNIKEKDNKKYPIYSLYKKEGTTDFSIFIENNILKMDILGKIYDLFNNIEYNRAYILWHFHQGDNKKDTSIFYLNENKIIKKNLTFNKEPYDIHIGFEKINNKDKDKNNIKQNNFTGIIGSYILFNNCFISDDDSNKSKIFEEVLLGLKCNYEDIIYINYETEFSSLNFEIKELLKKFESDDISRFIEVIISNKSITNNDFCCSNKNKKYYKANYFMDKNNDKSMISYNIEEDINIKNNLITYPFYFSNTFDNFINNNGIKFFELQLYYFIGVMGSYSLINKEKNRPHTELDNKIMELSEEKDSLYLKLQSICNLFLYCYQNMNEIQEKKNENDINNFFITLNNLISLNSKNDFKINMIFLLSIINHLTLLINKNKFFNYFAFIFEYESYAPHDDKIFELLFQTILIYLDEYNTNFLSTDIFSKLLNFDKLFIDSKILKNTKKIYSALIRKCLSLSLLNNNDECFLIYIKKLKNYTTINKPNELYKSFNYITEEDFSEDSENIYNLKLEHKKSLKEKKSLTNINLEIEKEEINNLILEYKYLKNLYLSLEDDNKKTHILVKFWENEENMNDFLNEEFKYLSNKYEINKMKYSINSKMINNDKDNDNENNNYVNYDDEDEDEDNKIIQINEENNKKNNININIKEETKQKLKIAELIKSLCIRFLDDINYENNSKFITNELKEKKIAKESISNNSSLRSTAKTSISSISLYKPISSFTLKTPRKSIGQKNGDHISVFNLNSAQNLANRKFDIQFDSIDSILISNYDFFNSFTISPYTFNSFFVSLFRNMPNKSKLKYIKNIIKKEEKLFLEEKNYIIIRFYTRIIIQLIQRVGEEDSDTFFMDKLEFLEYVYQKFNNLLMNMLNYYNDMKLSKKEKIKPMINNLFCSKENAFSFYLNVFDNLKTQKDMLNMIYVFDSKVIKNINKDNNEITFDNFFKKVKNNLYDIINNTIYKLIDPFYFKLLFEIYIKDKRNNDNCKFVFETIEYIINLFYNYKIEDISDSNSKKMKNSFEFNNKNLLILIYKLVFYKTKRKFLIQNIKPIVLYLVTFLSRTKLIFLKVLFPIEEPGEIKNAINKKLILEILFEIYFELYLEYKNLAEEEDEEEIKNKYENESSIFEQYIIQLLVIKNTSQSDLGKDIFSLFESFTDVDEDNKNKKKRKKKNWEYSICYMIDKLSIMQNRAKNMNQVNNNSNKINTFNELDSLRNYALKKYQKEYVQDENDFSVTIIFLIKLTLYMQELEKKEKDSTLLNFLIKTSELLCEDAQRLQQKYITYNPLLSKSENQTELYEDFKNYILNEYNLNKKYDKEYLSEKININEKESRKYKNVLYNILGKAKIVSWTSNTNLYLEKRKSFYKDSYSSYEEESSYSRNSIKDEKNDNSSINLLSQSVRSLGKLNNLNLSTTTELNNIFKEKFDFFRVSSSFFLKKKEKIKLLEYKIVPKFMKNFVRNYFSLYLIKLLTYDEDFINVKKIYYYLYHNEINDINKYYLNYPTKLKNRIGNNYTKHFLKKDFNFTTSEYFKYSHRCIHERNFIPKTKYLFPSKTIINEYDYAHKDIILNKNDKMILCKNCELITYEGSVFGYIYLFQNCILFKSDRENDKRKIDNLLDCACCCMEFDFLEKDKTKIIELTEIKEVISRKFLYSWISLEIFMKDGYSHLFNFFSEELNYEILDLFKNNGIPVIKNIKEYFDKEEFSKKWKDGKISTYNYLLILNKFSSRTYNDTNQYPVMPWIYLYDKSIRDFDIPMSIQDEESKQKFLKIPANFSDNENRWHSNHYSTSAYICYYLMRINPFTEAMIKFQSNNFDVPDRQFFNIGQTLILCQVNNNNREPIPELYTIPEVYINLNNNDFGKQSERSFGGRIHNVGFSRYADNAYDFIYKFKYMLNNNEEVNMKINEWFDFIFGINQFNKDNKTGKGLRNFNKYSYGQNIDIKKIISELKRNKIPDNKIYSKIKEILGMIISFGQCPFQILTEKHPKRIYNNGINISLSFYNDINEKDLLNENNEEQEIKENENISFQILYDDENKKHNIIYFKKSIYNNNLYCICNNKEIEIYQKEGKNKEYKYKKKINISKNYLLFKKNEKGYPIISPQYLFCELKEEQFIFCRYLDNSIKFVLPNMELKYLLDSFITSIIRINEKEFITGNKNGQLYHWYIDLDDILNLKLKLIKKINSNNNSIISILYNKELNIIISSDRNSVIIRSFHDFEFLTYININDNNENADNEMIVDIKISNYDLLYILIKKGNDEYILKGYSLNGICFGKYEEKITNFELTEEGKVLVGLAKVGIINVLDPISFKVIYSRFVIPKEECLFYHFYFEKPNILFFGYKEKDDSNIRIIKLTNDETKYFI